MYIKSDFVDYYDNHMRHGIDFQNQYHRTTRQLSVPEIITICTNPTLKQNMENVYGGGELKVGFVLFCGNIYNFIKFPSSLTDFSGCYGIEYCYTLEQYEKVLKKRVKSDSESKIIYGREGKYSDILEVYNYNRKRFIPGNILTKTNLKDLFEGRRYNKLDLLNIHREFKTPIVRVCFNNFFYYTNDRFPQNEIHATADIDVSLREMDFYKVLNSFQVFQEISMFRSNYLLDMKEPLQLSDSIRIQKHGFDLKTSFRKRKNG